MAFSKINGCCPDTLSSASAGFGRSCPEITKFGSSGTDPTAPGHPIATRLVIYQNAEGQKVTLSVGLYANHQSAVAAFEVAKRLSEAEEGFSPLPSPKLGPGGVRRFSDAGRRNSRRNRRSERARSGMLLLRRASLPTRKRSTTSPLLPACKFSKPRF